MLAKEGRGAAAIAKVSIAPAITKVVAITEVEGRFGDVDLRNRNGGGGSCRGGNDASDGRAGGRRFTGNVRSKFLLFDDHFVFRRRIVADDCGYFLLLGDHHDDAQNDSNKGDDQERRDEADHG